MVTLSAATAANVTRVGLEGDGLADRLFEILWNRDILSNTALALRIPETVIFRYNSPVLWYFTSVDGTIKRKSKAKVTREHVRDHFFKNPKPSGIVAYYVSSQNTNGSSYHAGFGAEPGAETQTTIEYFDRAALEDFLFARQKRKEDCRDGILQKFVEPKEDQNNMIKALWSPKVCMLERRVNRLKISDPRYDIYERAVTFEGDDCHSVINPVRGPGMVKKVNDIADSIVQHVALVTHDKMKISRMGLIFKLDDKDQLWLLFASSVRLQDELKKSRTLTPAVAASMHRQHFQNTPLEVNTVLRVPENIRQTRTMQHTRPAKLQQSCSCRACSRKADRDMLFQVSYKVIVEYEEHRNKQRCQGNQEDDDVQGGEPQGIHDFAARLPPPLSGTVLRASVSSPSLRRESIGEKLQAAGHESLQSRSESPSPLSARSVIDYRLLGRKFSDNCKVANKEVPPAMQKLHPRLTSEEYQRFRNDPAFLQKNATVCETCYLRFSSVQLGVQRQPAGRLLRQAAHNNDEDTESSEEEGIGSEEELIGTQRLDPEPLRRRQRATLRRIQHRTDREEEQYKVRSNQDWEATCYRSHSCPKLPSWGPNNEHSALFAPSPVVQAQPGPPSGKPPLWAPKMQDRPAFIEKLQQQRREALTPQKVPPLRGDPYLKDLQEFVAKCPGRGQALIPGGAGLLPTTHFRPSKPRWARTQMDRAPASQRHERAESMSSSSSAPPSTTSTAASTPSVSSSARDAPSVNAASSPVASQARSTLVTRRIDELATGNALELKSEKAMPEEAHLTEVGIVRSEPSIQAVAETQRRKVSDDERDAEVHEEDEVYEDDYEEASSCLGAGDSASEAFRSEQQSLRIQHPQGASREEEEEEEDEEEEEEDQDDDAFIDDNSEEDFCLDKWQPSGLSDQWKKGKDGISTPTSGPTTRPPSTTSQASQSRPSSHSQSWSRPSTQGPSRPTSSVTASRHASRPSTAMGTPGHGRVDSGQVFSHAGGLQRPSSSPSASSVRFPPPLPSSSSSSARPHSSTHGSLIRIANSALPRPRSSPLLTGGRPQQLGSTAEFVVLSPDKAGGSA